jgi:hypothetical protein
VDLHHIKIKLGQCEIKDDWLYVRNRLYVFYHNETRTRIIKKIHELLPERHAGRESIYVRVSKEYYWLRMTDLISRYVKSCHVCKRLKSYRNEKHGLLNSLPIPDRYWTDISVNFITGLLKCIRDGRVFEHIMIMINRLLKKKKFVALDFLEIKAVIKVFIEWIWREEEYLERVMLDRGI